MTKIRTTTFLTDNQRCLNRNKIIINIGAYVYLAPLCKIMKTVGKTDVYLPLLRVTSIFNVTRNVNLRDFTSFYTNFLDFRFQKASDFIDFK